MENIETIKKINTIGKGASAVAIVAKIVLVIGFIATLVTGIAMLFVPDDFISADVNADAHIFIDGDKLPFVFSGSIEEVSKELQDVDVDFADFTLDIKDNSKSDDELDFTMDMHLFELDGRDLSFVIGVGLIFSSLIFVAMYVIMIFVHKLAKALSTCQSPFEENVVKRMKHFAFSMIPWAVLSCFGGNISNGVNIGINIDVISVLVVAMIFLLVYIFDFGAQLQRQADETL
ncbi:MAG: hypothetical protein IJO29_05420 [Oscillospiraceae bacterium]|nr:hypothetical protein [Oscillospiraceae bacterium]